MDPGALMEQVQRMQEEFLRTLSQKTVEASAGGGMVTVVVNGAREVVSLRIDPQVIDTQDPGMLQDLIDPPQGFYPGLWVTASQVWVAGGTFGAPGAVVLHRPR